jgi:hypothetical protein
MRRNKLYLLAHAGLLLWGWNYLHHHTVVVDTAKKEVHAEIAGSGGGGGGGGGAGGMIYLFSPTVNEVWKMPDKNSPTGQVTTIRCTPTLELIRGFEKLSASEKVEWAKKYGDQQ